MLTLYFLIVCLEKLSEGLSLHYLHPHTEERMILTNLYRLKSHILYLRKNNGYKLVITHLTINSRSINNDRFYYQNLLYYIYFILFLSLS